MPGLIVTGTTRAPVGVRSATICGPVVRFNVSGVTPRSRSSIVTVAPDGCVSIDRLPSVEGTAGAGLCAQMYAASLLGLLWSYIQPALRFAVYYVVMGFVLQLHKDTPYFAIHLFTGIVVVHYFGETWAGGTRSIWQNKALVKKMRMPREIFPVASMLVAAYHTLPQILLLVVACLFAGWHLTWTAIGAGLLGVCILVTFAMAMALVFSALNVFFRDFQNIVGTIMQFMHFVVPMLYPFTRIYAAHESHPVIYQIYNANPIAQGVLLLQRLFWYPLIEDPSPLGTQFPPDMYVRGFITLALCLVFLWFAQKLFSRLENKFPERL